MIDYKNNIKLNALTGIINGISICSNIVKPTMGPCGSNVMIEQDFYPYHIITNDGATIIDNIQLQDPLEKRGHALLKEATDRSNKYAGDGSSTTVILTEAILKNCLSLLNPMEAKRSLDELLPFIESELDKNSRKIELEDIDSVALISSESESLSKKIKEIYQKIGRDGVIQIEGSGTFDTSYHIIDGVRFQDTGYLSPYFANKGKTAVYENPTILVTKTKINHLNDINPLLERLSNEGKKDLIIFCDDMDAGVAQVLINGHKSGIINLCIIKAPVIFKQYVYEDFAKCVGATIVEEITGVTFKNLKLTDLGTCGKIVVDRDETIITGIQDISEHITTLKAQGDNDSYLRLQWLKTKTAILKLGANSESELSYLKPKAEDTVNSCRLALDGGIVIGGGMALYNLIEKLPNTIGGDILRESLGAPSRQIIKNAGFENITIKSGSSDGFDAKLGIVRDMWDAKIIDATKIVKNAIRNAIGVASTTLTISSLISKPEETPEQIAYKLAQNKNRPF